MNSYRYWNPYRRNSIYGLSLRQSCPQDPLDATLLPFSSFWLQEFDDEIVFFHFTWSWWSWCSKATIGWRFLGVLLYYSWTRPWCDTWSLNIEYGMIPRRKAGHRWLHWCWSYVPSNADLHLLNHPWYHVLPTLTKSSLTIIYVTCSSYIARSSDLTWCVMLLLGPFVLFE